MIHKLNWWNDPAELARLDSQISPMTPIPVYLPDWDLSKRVYSAGYGEYEAKEGQEGRAYYEFLVDTSNFSFSLPEWNALKNRGHFLEKFVRNDPITGERYANTQVIASYWWTKEKLDSIAPVYAYTIFGGDFEYLATFYDGEK